MELRDKIAEKARNLAYRKPLVKNLNYDHITDEVYEIMESCENIRYYLDEDSNILDSIFDDDEEAAKESWQANGEIVKRFDRLLLILPEQMWLI